MDESSKEFLLASFLVLFEKSFSCAFYLSSLRSSVFFIKFSKVEYCLSKIYVTPSYKFFSYEL